jgi:hypothetical protein
MGIFSGSMIRRRVVVDPLLDGLVEWWWLDSANGRFGAKGAFDLTENGTLTKNASGGPGGEGYTSGIAAANTNFYSLAHDAAFDVGSSYTVSWWAQVPDPTLSANAFYRCWGKGAESETNSHFADVQINDATTPTAGGPRYNPKNAGFVFNTGLSDPQAWHHYVARLDYTGNTRSIWRNGTSISSGAATGAAGNSLLLRVMSINGGANNPNMALFGWWDRALDSDEISRLYGSGTPLTPADIGL